MNNEESKKMNIKTKLIEERHSHENHIRFVEHIRNPVQTKRLWDELSKKIGMKDGQEARKQYNNLVSKYRTIRDHANKTGSTPSRWKYFALFQNTFPKDCKLNLYLFNFKLGNINFKMGIVKFKMGHVKLKWDMSNSKWDL